jgi:hypothetical protein
VPLQSASLVSSRPCTWSMVASCTAIYLSAAEAAGALADPAAGLNAVAAAARCGSGTGCAGVAAPKPLDTAKRAVLPSTLSLALPLPADALLLDAAAAAAAACFWGRKPARAMMAARATPSSSRAVCPLSGKVTRRASGSTDARRAASAIDGSSRSAADATSSVGALRVRSSGWSVFRVVDHHFK